MSKSKLENQKVAKDDDSEGNEDETLGDLGLWGGNDKTKNTSVENENAIDQFDPTAPEFNNQNQFDMSRIAQFQQDTDDILLHPNGVGQQSDEASTFRATMSAETDASTIPGSASELRKKKSKTKISASDRSDATEGTENDVEIHESESDGLIDLVPRKEGVSVESAAMERIQNQHSVLGDQPLSFEDPRFFELDSILGPDQEIEAKQKRNKDQQTAKRISKKSRTNYHGSASSGHSRPRRLYSKVDKDNDNDRDRDSRSQSTQSEGQEEYDSRDSSWDYGDDEEGEPDYLKDENEDIEEDLEKDDLDKAKDKANDMDRDKVNDTDRDKVIDKGNEEIEGEGNEEAEPEPEQVLQRLLVDSSATSLQEFEDIYMQLSDGCAMSRLSKENLSLTSRQSTPSPPATPTEVMAKINSCPSIESFLKLADQVRINFHVLPGQKVYSKDVRLDRTFAEIKSELAHVVKVPAKYIELRRNKNLVMDYKTLKDVGGKAGKKMRFSIEVSKRAMGVWELKIPQENKLEYRPQTQKSVRIHTGKAWKSVNVSIEYPTDRKLFLGGFKHKLTGKEYHNASSQTPSWKKYIRDTQEHKATQSFHESTGCSQTSTETYTQVDRPDYFSSCQNQKLIVVKSYQSACRWEKMRNSAAITIQKYWRRWLAIKEREDRMVGLIKRVEWAEQVRKGRTETRLAIKDDELYRQYNPSSLLDIELLYRAINRWRKQEVDYVLAHRWGAEKKAALADIMEKEADLLLDLERAKSKIMDEKNKHLVENLYKKMGAPTRWLTRTGQFITLDTPEKAQARALHDIYHELQQPVKNAEERLLLLDKLYKLTKDHRTVTSDYLVQLIGREITLMQRNARERLLTGLRKRILNGFFALCRDDTFNPESKTLQKIPFDVMKLRKDMVQCQGCRKMLYRDQFTITHGVTVTNRCLTCMGLYRTCILRVDLNLYRRMLQELRHDEQKQGVESSISYLIDAYDLQFLVEKLWHGQSALSGIDDRYLLNLCRWIKDKPWTPWNCVLLTEEEAVAHLHIGDMTIAYQQSFFEKVRLRHNAARSYFERTAKTSLGLDTNLHIYCMTKEKEKEIRRAKQKQNSLNKKKPSIPSITSRISSGIMR